MDALTLLKDDHDKVKGMLDKLEKTTERAEVTRTEGLQALKQELTTHEAIEEEILYPALKEFAKTKDITLEAYEEHHVVDTIMAELEQTPVDDETWAAKFTVMKENLEHHIEEEEGEMFKKARQVMDGERAQGARRAHGRAQGRAPGRSMTDEASARQQPFARDLPAAAGPRVLLRRARGRPVSDEATLERIRSLAIPPAWDGRVDLSHARRAPPSARDGCGGTASVPVSRGMAFTPEHPEVPPDRAVRRGAPEDCVPTATRAEHARCLEGEVARTRGQAAR